MSKKTKKVNLVTADRTMNERVSEFATVKLSKITDATRHAKAIKELQDNIRGFENARGAFNGDFDIDAAIAAVNAKIAKLEEDYKAACKKKAQFVYTKEDIELFNAYRDGDDMTEAYIAWAAAWKLDLRDTDLLKDLIRGTSGLQGVASARTIINSEFATMTRERSRQNFLNLTYAMLCERCVAKGLKMDIPQDIRDYYAPKTRKQAQ